MHTIITKLKNIIQTKQTNLCVAADLLQCAEVLNLAKKLGDKICMLKTHVDILADFTPEFPKQLRKIADEKNFLIFEDRKFADIGNTVSLQFGSGIYKIADWADIINAHTIIGEGIIDGLKKANKKSALILLAQMTPKGNLFTKEYLQKTVEMAKKHDDFVIGFIGSSDRPELLRELREVTGEDLMIFVPGVRLQTGGDALAQTYNSPKQAMQNGADVIIVGRGILEADDMVAEADRYISSAGHWLENKLPN
jgi:uridine monophosphate synthetase